MNFNYHPISQTQHDNCVKESSVKDPVATGLCTEEETQDYTLCLESGVNDPGESGFRTEVECSNGRYACLVAELVAGSGHSNRIRERLSSPDGHFSENEASVIMADILAFIVNHQPHTRSGQSETAYAWASGVIAYYLLCGYPYPRNSDEEDFYNGSNLGPKIHTEEWNKMVRKRHSSTSRKWDEISDDVKKFVNEGLLHTHPGNRLPPDEASMNAWIMNSWFDWEGPTSNEPTTSDDGMVTVREHSRKKPKAGKTGKCKTVQKRAPSMDIASFKSIIQIQQDGIDYYKKKNIDNSDHKKTRDTWNEFWNGAKQSKKRKRAKYVWKSKQDEAKKNEKRFLKAINDLTKPMTKKDWDCCPC